MNCDTTKVAFWPVLGLLISAGVTAVPLSPPSGKPLLVVTLQSTEIQALDPLVIRVSLVNDTEKPVTLDRWLDDKWGYVGIEMRRNFEGDYVEVGTKYSEHMKWANVFTPQPVLLAPNESQAAYVILFRWKDRAVFRQPGTYELRAWKYVDCKKVHSEPVAVTVHAIPESERRVIEQAQDVLDQEIDTDITASAVKAARLKEIERTLSSSNLKKNLRWILAVSDVRQAKADESRKRARANCDELRNRVDDVTADVMGLALAKQYVAMKEWKNAATVLGTIKHVGYETDSLQKTINYEQECDRNLNPVDE